jgi:hypothetical protein
MTKIVQICTLSETPDSWPVLMALTDDGRIYALKVDSHGMPRGDPWAEVMTPTIDDRHALDEDAGDD